MLSTTFNGAAHTVTGSLFYFEYENKGKTIRFCVDAGMFQTGENIDLKTVNANLFFDPQKLDFIILTHAHLDHCGRIPHLVKRGFKGKVYSTPATRDLADIVMMDSAKQRYNKYDDLGDEEEENILDKLGVGDFLGTKDLDVSSLRDKKLYHTKEAVKAVSLFEVFDYHTKFKPCDNLEVEFFNAGHIFGSSFVVIKEVSTGRKIVFSGDMGNIDKPIIEDPERTRPQNNLTHIFTETTYGGRLHGELNPKEALRSIVKNTIYRNGKVLIPSFSVQRAQEVIYHLVELISERKIPQVPIYLDSPMAARVVKVMKKYPNLYDKEMIHKVTISQNPLLDKNLTIIGSREESKKLNYNQDPCIIIAGSGMVTGGRILKHLKFHARFDRNALIFVGYQAEGTTGRKISEGLREVKIDRRLVTINAQVENINEFSAHADKDGLKKWIKGLFGQRVFSGEEKPTIVLVHGAVKQALALRQNLKENFQDKADYIIPQYGEKVVLWEE